MGAWGTSLYANDSTCEVRDTYIKFLEKQLGNQESYEKTLEKCQEYIGDQDEPLFWFALAETQWRVGRLMPEVKAKALEWIEKDGGIELWEDSKNGSAGWKKTFEKLRVKLETEQPKEKRFRKLILPFQNPWNLNDVYAYRVHIKRNFYDEDVAYGKYILIQKIGEENSIGSKDIIMRVQIFDRLFDEIPTIDGVFETIRDYRLLPLSYPDNQKRRYKLRLLGKPDPQFHNEPLCRYDPVIMSTKLENCYYNQGYPKDELTYICTVESSHNKQHERSDGYADRDLYWWEFNSQVDNLFASWKNVEYEIIGDGTFEYPTRKQQAQIRAEIEKTNKPKNS